MSHKAYRGCPCLLRDKQRAFCLNEENLPEVSLVSTEGDAPLWGEKGVCHNIVLAGEDGYLQCPSTGSHVKVRGENISNDLFEETYNLAKLAFTDPSSCTQCLYNLLASEVSKKKVAVLVLGETPAFEAYKKNLADKLKKLIPEKDFLIISGKQRAATPQIILKGENFIVNLPAPIPVDELEKKISRLLNRAITPG